MSCCHYARGKSSDEEVRRYIQDLLASCGPPYVRGEYGADWTSELRGRVRRRDGGRCVVCGGEDRLCVHHCDGDKGRSEMGNLVTLCWGCHEKVHGG